MPEDRRDITRAVEGLPDADVVPMSPLTDAAYVGLLALKQLLEHGVEPSGVRRHADAGAALWQSAHERTQQDG